jgi:hypothetical protein
MRYQQFASHAYCGAAGPVFEMVSKKGEHRKPFPAGNWYRGLAVSMRSEMLLVHEKLGQLPLLTVCKVRNKFLVNF